MKTAMKLGFTFMLTLGLALLVSMPILVQADPPPDPPPPLQPGVGHCNGDPQIPGCVDQYPCSESMLVIDRTSCNTCVYNRIVHDAYFNGSQVPSQWQASASSDAMSCQQKYPDLQGN